MHIDTYHLPEIETRYHHHPDLPDYETLEFSAEDDAKITKAANWSRSLLLRARAGDAQALKELETKMHVTKWKVMR